MSIRRIRCGSGHRYTVDGKKTLGVTTILKLGMPKPALPNWAARRVAEYVADADPDFLANLRRDGREQLVAYLKNVPWAERDAAAGRGTDIHAYAEQLAHGGEVDPPEPLRGHVESCVKFLDSWRVAPVLTEFVVAHRTHKYAGTADLLGDLPDGRRCIFDWKTGASGIWPETALQLCAYRRATHYLDADGREQVMAKLGIDAAYGVWLRADGYDVIPVETGDQVWRTFTHVAAVARTVDTMARWVGEAETWGAA